MVHTNKTNATTPPTTASPTSVTDTDSVVAIPRDGQHFGRPIVILLGDRHAVDRLEIDLALSLDGLEVSPFDDGVTRRVC